MKNNLEDLITKNKSEIFNLVNDLDSKYLPEFNTAYRSLNEGVSREDLLDPDTPEIENPYHFDFVKRKGLILDVISNGDFDFSRYSVVFDIDARSIYHTSYRSDTKETVPILEFYGNRLVPVFNVQIPDITGIRCTDKNDWMKYHDKIVSKLKELKQEEINKKASESKEEPDIFGGRDFAHFDHLFED
ncbi:Uncharacterised protein [Candidatus Tiddalikarchaeum anstoanum]|nr:Uncharacterised protein [Candidatus Tiddalikarchaeum anstoanum]